MTVWSAVRTRLIRQMGQRNSESTLYQKMLAQVANQYADMRPADMTADTDASRLFSTDEVVPGMFTRQAREQAVQPAIEKVVAERRDEMDWVLSDTKQPAAQSTSPEALRAGWRSVISLILAAHGWISSTVCAGSARRPSLMPLTS